MRQLIELKPNPHRGMSCNIPSSIRKLKIVPIKPSKYDDDGYVIRAYRGVISSNSLHNFIGLNEALRHRGALSPIEIEITPFDEIVQKIPFRRIRSWSQRQDTHVVVPLVGVQTNQWPRALDIGRQFLDAGIDVIVGGFHTSGMIRMFGVDEASIQEALDNNITVVAGEVDYEWEHILHDALQGKLKPVYDFLSNDQELPDITGAPLPVIPKRLVRRFGPQGTIESARGCPYACTFCSVINIQGRKVRARDPERVIAFVRESYHRHGMAYYLFTDDDFARNKKWRQLFEGLAKLRQEEGIPLRFLMQVDTLVWKIPDFVELAKQAGCQSVFIGMESVNPDNLHAAGKTQNHVAEYAEMIEVWHAADIIVHVGWITGFPFDTVESIQRDVETLKSLGVDIASFFVLANLPGSMDHFKAQTQGIPMEADYNRRDTHHVTMEHPNMTTEEWELAYRNAWVSFNSVERLEKTLQRFRHNRERYWSLLRSLFWWTAAMAVQGEHPMLTGFFRLKDRTTRRPGFEVDPLWAHVCKRIPEISQEVLGYARIIGQFAAIWRRTYPYEEAPVLSGFTLPQFVWYYTRSTLGW